LVPGNLNYNPLVPGNANYNPIVPGNANYNPIIPAAAGNPSSALGVTAPGSPTGGTPATPVGETLVSYYTYPDNATYPVTVASGGSITIKVS
jgi:hypothetical protein